MAQSTRIERLLDAAFSILQHDTGEQDPEWVWQRNALRDKFQAILESTRHGLPDAGEVERLTLLADQRREEAEICRLEADSLRADLAAAQAALATAREEYNELLMAVGHKFDGETRHQTALRYIREREQISNVQGVGQEATRQRRTP